jgi:hypothetical protein
VMLRVQGARVWHPVGLSLVGSVGRAVGASSLPVFQELAMHHNTCNVNSQRT